MSDTTILQKIAAAVYTVLEADGCFDPAIDLRGLGWTFAGDESLSYRCSNEQWGLDVIYVFESPITNVRVGVSIFEPASISFNEELNWVDFVREDTITTTTYTRLDSEGCYN